MKTESKLCANNGCDKRFHRAPHSSNEKWAARKYCSHQCANEVRNRSFKLQQITEVKMHPIIDAFLIGRIA